MSTPEPENQTHLFVPFVFFFFSIPFSDHKSRVKYLLSRCVFELVIWGLFSLMASESWILPEDLSLLVCFAVWAPQSFPLLSSDQGVCIWKDLSLACQKSARGGGWKSCVLLCSLTAETLKLLCGCAHKLVVEREREKYYKWKQSGNGSVS